VKWFSAKEREHGSLTNRSFCERALVFVVVDTYRYLYASHYAKFLKIWRNGEPRPFLLYPAPLHSCAYLFALVNDALLLPHPP
jgi:hypothetical protein